MNFANSARRFFIKTGKILPFALCLLVFISYSENLLSLTTGNYQEYYDYSVINTPVSFFIGRYFEYDLLTIVVTLIISFAIEACMYNRLAIAYLAANLWFKQYIFNVELEEITIAVFCIIHCIIAAFLVYKGVRILLK